MSVNLLGDNVSIVKCSTKNKCIDLISYDFTYRTIFNDIVYIQFSVTAGLSIGPSMAAYYIR